LTRPEFLVADESGRTVTLSSTFHIRLGNCLSMRCFVSHPRVVKSLIALGFLAFAAVLQAQRDRSSLTGTVVDNGGGVIPGVSVRAVEKGSGLARVTMTNREGVYAIAGLVGGSYSVTFTRAGFAPVRFESIDQPVGLTRTLDVTLTLSAKGEHVTVSEAVAQLDRTTAALGQGVEQKQVEELPLNGRNWASLTALVAGAFDSGGSNQRSVRFAGRGLVGSRTGAVFRRFSLSVSSPFPLGLG
jgi:Carboxypeptidase regulatory-like domain